MEKINVIGAGLAGSEAAYQLAKRGYKVNLYEQKKVKKSPAHKSDLCAELICSNSLRAAGLTNAVGLMKEEMRQMDSLIMACADKTRVPAGGALAVDREAFAQAVTDVLRNHENINFIDEEITEIPEGYTIIASGPLTEGKLLENIGNITGNEYLHFHDAVAPIVSLDSVDMTKAYRASRYDKGELPEGDYINCPMTEEEYENFYNELINAELAPLHDFEKEHHFEGCMPVEAMAKRGRETLTFGPLKPVGLDNPHDNSRPYAVVQLRQDNGAGTLYNIVGFQTRLKWGEQKRVFSMIPGLENCEIIRYGVMHLNSYINSPKVLGADLRLKSNDKIYFAGQITGVEGYIESAGAGLVAGINLSRQLAGKEPLKFPTTTAIGGLMNYISVPNYDFQPMNVNFGLVEPLGYKVRKKAEKNQLIAERSLKVLDEFIKENEI